MYTHIRVCSQTFQREEKVRALWAAERNNFLKRQNQGQTLPLIYAASHRIKEISRIKDERKRRTLLTLELFFIRSAMENVFFQHTLIF